MNSPRQRPLAVGPIRAFEAVARRLSFRAAAEELYLTQSAISRQIQALEEEMGAVLFTRGTRHVSLTGAGAALLQAVAPALARLDGAVRQIRASRGRRIVTITTFASFASLWLLPRLETYQREQSDIDIRLDTSDRMVDLEEPEVELVLRYCEPHQAPEGSQRLFGETLTPVVSPWFAERAARGEIPALKVPSDLAHHTLLEEDDTRPSAVYLSWRHWLDLQGQGGLEPQRWVYLRYTYQQVQAAMSGQGVAMARLALVAEALARGELVEPFGVHARVRSPCAYWLAIAPGARPRTEVRALSDWVLAQAALTRAAIGENTA